MNWQDTLNGLFELMGGFFILPSVIRLWKDKKVRGVSWIHVLYFSTWGYWNLYYYPHLEQWLSFSGGIFLVIVNSIWAVQMIYYIKKEKT